MRQPAEGPQFTLSVLLLRAVISTPVAPAGACNDVFPAGVVFAQLQWARQPRLPPAIQIHRGCPLEAAMFAYRYGPHASLALLWSGLLLPSFRRLGRPSTYVGYD